MSKKDKPRYILRIDGQVEPEHLAEIRRQLQKWLNGEIAIIDNDTHLYVVQPDGTWEEIAPPTKPVISDPIFGVMAQLRSGKWSRHEW